MKRQVKDALQVLKDVAPEIFAQIVNNCCPDREKECADDCAVCWRDAMQAKDEEAEDDDEDS